MDGDGRQGRDQERGQTMVEYVVVLSMITIAILAAFVLIGDTAAVSIGDVADVLS